MKIIKKILSIFTAAAMAAGLAVSASAAAVPAASDAVAASVAGVESGATIAAYQIVEGEYNSYGLTGYAAADALEEAGLSIEDITNPTADEVTAIAQAIVAGDVTLTSVQFADYDSSTGCYSGSIGAGTWIVLVTGNESGAIYNPMLVSASYTNASDADTLTAGLVSAGGSFTYMDDGETVAAYAKKASVTLEKTITNYADDGDDPENENEKGAAYNIGDVIEFEIATQIPAYSDAYDNGLTVYELTDTQSDGLAAVTGVEDNSIVVKVGGTAYEEGEDTFTITIDSSANTFVITFESGFVIDHAGESVVVTYETTLDDEAAMAADANPNEVQLEYSTAIAEETGAQTSTIEDEVYVYTFAITDEIVKVTSGSSVSVADDGTTVTASSPLSGAVFALYSDAACTEAAAMATSDENGYVSFSGLDAGTYYLVETAAPSGYALGTTIYTVVIDAVYNDDGTMSGYTVAVSAGSTSNTSTYAVSYDGDDAAVDSTEVPTGIANTTLSVLPNTGASGIYIFIIASVALFALAAFIAARKRAAKDAGK